MLVLPSTTVGHLMHEDNPEETAQHLKLFLKQFRIPLNAQQLEKLEEIGVAKFTNGL